MTALQRSRYGTIRLQKPMQIAARSPRVANLRKDRRRKIYARRGRGGGLGFLSARLVWRTIISPPPQYFPQLDISSRKRAPTRNTQRAVESHCVRRFYTTSRNGETFSEKRASFGRASPLRKTRRFSTIQNNGKRLSSVNQRHSIRASTPPPIAWRGVEEEGGEGGKELASLEKRRNETHGNRIYPSVAPSI